MKKKLLIILASLFCLIIVSCTTHIHKIGDGPQVGHSTSQSQWFILFGLVPLNQVDTNEMAGDIENYEIKTSSEPLDILINIPASYITVSRRTVTVTK